jgi:hypothetical protein
MARGLYGEDSYNAYIPIYDYLKKQSDSGKIRILFSWTHIVESLRYYDLTSELWKTHCSVVDALTKGNCIIFPVYLQEIELDLFLSNYIGINSQYPKFDYAFGFYKDAFPRINIQHISINEHIEDAIKKAISTSGLSRNGRRMILKKISDKKYLHQYLSNISEEDFGRLVSKSGIAGQSNSFISDLGRFLDRETFINFMAGTSSVRFQIFNKFIENIFNFKTIVNRYSQIFPELRQMAQSPDKSFEKLGSMIDDMKLIQNLFLKPIVIDPNQLKTDLVNKYMVSLEPKINEFIKKHNLSKNEVKKLLIESHFKPLPSIHSAILFCVEYAKRHVGVLKKARRPIESDIIDLNNLRNLPYVDLYVTDNFFADLSGKIAKIYFGTLVYKKLFQLKEYLENNLVS